MTCNCTALAEQNGLLVEALKHQLNRQHENSSWCSGCELSNKVLAEPIRFTFIQRARQNLISKSLAYHHAKDREESKQKKLELIEACANYEADLAKVEGPNG